eukprot:8500350-Alexandrium_andersonii.AAC.1
MSRARALRQGNLGCHFAAQQVALSRHARRLYGTSREAAPRGLRRASVERGWPHCWADRPRATGQ